MKVKNTWYLLIPGVFFLSINFGVSFVKLDFLYQLGYFLFLLSLYQVLKRVKLSEILPVIIFFTSALLFIYGIFQRCFIFPYFLELLSQSDKTFLSNALLGIIKTGRIYSIFALPTLYALICSILLVYIIHCFIRFKNTFQRIGWATLFILGILNLLFTKSFGGIIYFSIGVISYFLMTGKIKIKNLGILIMGLFLIFSLVFVSRFSEAKELKPVKLRITSWNQSFRIITKYPFTGVGLGNFGAAVPRFIKTGEATSIYVHNFYLQLLSETGIFLLLFLLFFLYNFCTRIDYKNKDPEKPVYLSILISILMYNLIDIGFYFFTAGIIFVIALSQLPLKFDLKPLKKMTFQIIPLCILSLFLFLTHRSDSLQREGQISLDGKNYNQAISVYLKSLKFNPFNYKTLYEIADSYYQINNFKQAEFYIDKTLGLNPYHPSSNFLKSLLLLKKNQISSALYFSSNAVNLYPFKEKYRKFYEQLKKDFENRISNFKN